MGAGQVANQRRVGVGHGGAILDIDLDGQRAALEMNDAVQRGGDAKGGRAQINALEATKSSHTFYETETSQLHE